MGSVVADAQPIVAFLLDEPLADLVQTRLGEHRTTGSILMSAVNWCEVLYAVERQGGPPMAALAEGLRVHVPITVVDAGVGLASHAASAKLHHGLSLGDSFAAGTARALGLPLMTGDPDFLPLEDHGLEIDWVGPER